MRKDATQHRPSLLGVAYAENDVLSAVWFWARAQDGCLYVARFERRRARRNRVVDRLLDGKHASILIWGPGPFRTGPRAIAERRLSNLVEEFFCGLANA